MRAAKASRSPRAVSLIVFARIRSTAEVSPFDISALLAPLGANIKPHPSVAYRGLARFGKRPHLREMMLDLTEEETDALAKLLSRTIDDDRYPLSPLCAALVDLLRRYPQLRSTKFNQTGWRC